MKWWEKLLIILAVGLFIVVVIQIVYVSAVNGVSILP